MERKTFTIFLISIICLFVSLVPQASAQEDATYETLRRLLSNPRTIIIICLQGALGFGLGYFSMKALKYILAIILILICGILLNVWHFGEMEELFPDLDYQALLSIFNSLVSVIGLLTILPMGIGFILGLIVAIK